MLTETDLISSVQVFNKFEATLLNGFGGRLLEVEKLYASENYPYGTDHSMKVKIRNTTRDISTDVGHLLCSIEMHLSVAAAQTSNQWRADPTVPMNMTASFIKNEIARNVSAMLVDLRELRCLLETGKALSLALPDDHNPDASGERRSARSD